MNRAHVVHINERATALDRELLKSRLQALCDDLEAAGGPGYSVSYDVDERLISVAADLRDELARVVGMLGNMGEDGYIATVEKGWLYDNHGNRVDSVESFLGGPRAVLTKVGVEL
jgi:hypothetical protein